MTPLPTTKIQKLEAGLLADAYKLRGLDVRRLGYYGGPARTGEVALAHALDSEELEPFYDTEPERATAERQAQLLAGCLWRCSSVLIQGLFDDIHELQDIEESNLLADIPALRHEFIQSDSSVLHLLPPTSAGQYSSGFARKFLVVAAGMTTKLAGAWTPPSCLAEELAVHCLAGLVEDYAEDQGIDLDDDVEGTLYEALLEDTDHLFMYPVPGFTEASGIDPEEMVALLSATGFADLDFATWFEPFNSGLDRAVSPYAHAAGAPVRPRGEGFNEWEDQDAEAPEATEAYAPEARDQAIADGHLVDVTGEALTIGFNCPVAFTRGAYAATTGPEVHRSGTDTAERVTDVLLDAMKAASAVPERRSAVFRIDSASEGQPVLLEVVVGSSEPGAAVVTIQRGLHDLPG